MTTSNVDSSASSTSITAATEALMRAFVYVFPLHEMGALRAKQLGDGSAPGHMPVGRFLHMRGLAGPADRFVTAPNNDTLYSLAWLDLSHGPVQLSLPDTGGRYDSVAILDAYTNNVAILGQRVTGTRAADFVLVGPRWSQALPADSRVVRCPTDDTLVMVRILVSDAEDLPAVHALQNQLLLTPLVGGDVKPWARPLTRDAALAAQFVDIVNAMIARNPPPLYESQMLPALAAVGLSGTSWDALAPALQQQWTHALPTLLGRLRDHAELGRPTETGWTEAGPNLGDFGTDYGYRAIIALVGLLALAPAEAVYPSTRVDDRHEPLQGGRRYRLSIPSGGVPAGAFWSLSMYRLEDDGRLFFVDNPLGRYVIGDRTRGLKQNDDGSLDIAIQRDAPAASHQSNWLPAAEGPFVLILRAYHPSSDFRDGRFKLPAVQRVD